MRHVYEDIHYQRQLTGIWTNQGCLLIYSIKIKARPADNRLSPDFWSADNRLSPAKCLVTTVCN